MKFKVIDHDNDNSKTFDSRPEAEEKAEEMREMFDVECEVKRVEADGGTEVQTPTESQPVDVDGLPDDPKIDQDPLDYMPGHFVDDIQGTPAINRKGYAVLAAHYNIGVKAEPVVRASETEFEYAEFTAVATTEEGVEYSGFGSAHVDRMDGDDKYLLNELAETRACKRALALATGVGVVSAEEMRGSL